MQLPDGRLCAKVWYKVTEIKSRIWIVRINSIGALIWEKSFEFSNRTNSVLNSCWFQNKILISGGWFNHWGPSPFGKEYYTPFILELDTAGNTIFHKDFTDPIISGKLEMYKFNEEKLIVAGLSDSITDNSDFGVFIGMLDKNLNFIWRKHYADTIGYNPFVLKPLHDGNFLVVGGRYDLGHNYYCGMIDKYDSNGVMLWHRLYYKRENTENYLADFAEASNGDIICTGSVAGYVDSASVVHPQNVWILRTDSMGFISSTDSGFSDALGVIDISEDAIQDLKLFPNPAKNQLGLLYNIKEISQICIYSINGQQVFKGKLDVAKHEDQIDVSMLIPGMYIIEIINPKGKVSKRFSKE